MMRTTMVLLLLGGAVLAGAADAAAQARQPPQPARPQPARPQPAPRPQTAFRAVADIGLTSFTAAESFEATLGSASGRVFGVGAEVVLRRRFFFGVGVSFFQQDGERVFVHNGERFGLGIPMTVKVTPILISGGYRFGGPRAKLYPYLGGGVGSYGYAETSDFAQSGDDVTERFTGYHLLGGAEYRLSRLIGVAGEAQWATVPDALGQNPSGVTAAFDETDLGGYTVRVKVVIGR
jgi:opacity protein-like surface antigen